MLKFTLTGNIEVVLTKNNGLDADVNCVYGDASGTVWFGTAGSGLYKLRPPKFMNYLTSRGPDDSYIMAITADTAGRIIMGSSKSGLIRYDNSTRESFRMTTENGLPSNEIRGIYAADNNSLWLATAYGICVVENDKVEKIMNRDNGYFANYFRCITRLSDGTMAAGTMGDGLV